MSWSGGGGGGTGTTDHSALTNRDVAGNHAKIIPLTDGSLSLQIMKADGVTSLLTVDSLTEKFLLKEDYSPTLDCHIANQRYVKKTADVRGITDYTETYPEPKTYNAPAVDVATEAALIAAIAAANNYDTINLTADITLTATLVIGKPLKFTGAFILQSAGAAGDPVTLISVTGNDVYLTSSLTIKHRKTTNTSVENAVTLSGATGFISEAAVEFMEFGYILKGSFNIPGKTTYTGALGNTHRHFGIYAVSAASKIDGVEFDFPSEATPRDSFVYISANVAADKWNANLKISNCYQSDLTKIGRQFFLIDAFQSDGGASLIVENNRFNELNGDIGFVGASGQAVLDFFDYMAILNNFSGNAATAADSYKGLVFFDGSGALHDLGSCDFYYSGNVHSTTLRSAADYVSAYDAAGVAYKPAVYTIANFSVIKNTVPGSVYNWTAPLATRNHVEAGDHAQIAPPDGSLALKGKLKFDSVALLGTPVPGTIEYYAGKLYATYRSTPRVLDRTSDVALSSVTVENTTTETTVYTGLVPANSLIVGNILKMFMSGHVSEAAAADVCTIRVKIGGVTMATINSPGTGTGSQCFKISGFSTVRAIGATGSMAWHIDMNVENARSDTCDVSTFDTTTAENVTVTAQWNNAKVGNIFSLNQGFLEYKN